MRDRRRAIYLAVVLGGLVSPQKHVLTAAGQLTTSALPEQGNTRCVQSAFATSTLQLSYSAV